MSARRPATGRAGLRAAVCALAGAAVVAGAAAAPLLAPYWLEPGFRDLLLGVLVVPASAALAVTLVRLRRQPLPKLAGLAVVVLLAVLALRVGPTVTEPAARLREQTHVAQFGVLALLWSWLWRRRLPDGALYATALGYCLLVGLVDELVQWWIPVRVGTLADLRLDLLGGLVGTALAALVWFQGEVPLGAGRAGRALALRVAAGSVLGVAGFVHLVHLGHAHRVPGTPIAYRSRFEPGRLERVGSSWRPRPDGGPYLVRLARGEDFYGAEAAWHHAARNRFLADGEDLLAYQEQAVLESGYPAYLRERPDASLAPELRARLLAVEPFARRLGRDSGPGSLWTGLDPLTLWLVAAALSSGAALAAEWTLLRPLASAGPAGDARPHPG